jgi:hypothetical protein
VGRLAVIKSPYSWDTGSNWSHFGCKNIPYLLMKLVSKYTSHSAAVERAPRVSSSGSFPAQNMATEIFVGQKLWGTIEDLERTSVLSQLGL